MSNLAKKGSKPLLILVLLAVTVFAVGAAYIFYWESGPIGHQVEIYGADAKAFDLVNALIIDYEISYTSLTNVVSLTDRPDVRGLAFGLVLDPDSRFPDGDLSLKISATGTGIEGMTGVANIYYAVYFNYFESDSYILLFENDVNTYAAGGPGEGWADGSSLSAPYMTTNVNIDPLDDYTLSIPASMIDSLRYNWVGDQVIGDGAPPIEDCGGIWIFLEFDISTIPPQWPLVTESITIIIEFGTV